MDEQQVLRTIELPKSPRVAGTSTAAKVLLQLIASQIYGDSRISIRTIEQTFVFATGAAQNFTTQLPAGAYVLEAAFNFDTAIVLSGGTLPVKMALGTAAKANRFALSSVTVTKNSQTQNMPLEADAYQQTASGAVTMTMGPTNAAGTADGNAAGTVRCRVTYMQFEPLASAP